MNETVRQHFLIDNDDAIIAVIVMFAICALVIYRSKNRLIHRWTLFGSSRRPSGGEDFRETGIEILNYFLLTLVWAVSAGFLIYDNSQIEKDSSQLWLTALLFTGVIYAKAFLYSVINWIFFEPMKCRMWMSSYFFVIAISALLIFAFALIKIFMNTGHSCNMFFVTIVLILYKFLLFFKLHINFKPIGYGYLLIFLYFCTLELIPVMLLINFLK